jgi:hypothetical protein
MGTKPILSVEAKITDGGQLTYQWYESDDKDALLPAYTAIDSATAYEYLPNTMTEGTMYYYVRVTNVNSDDPNKKPSTVFSAKVEVEVGPKSVKPSKFATDLKSGEYKLYTGGIKLTVKIVAPSDLDDLSTLKFAWYKSDSANVATYGTLIDGFSSTVEKDTNFCTNGSEFALTLKELGTTYYAVKVIASIPKGDTVRTASDTAWSATAKIVVRAVEKPKITTEPASIEYIVGNAPTQNWKRALSVVATGENTTYQWQKKIIDTTSLGKDTTYWSNVAGATTSSYEPLPAVADDTVEHQCYYRVRVYATASVGGTDYKDSVDSKEVLVEAKQIITNLKIITEPASFTYTVGSQNTLPNWQKKLRVAAEGENLTYQWQNGVKGKKDVTDTTPSGRDTTYQKDTVYWNNVSGATSASYTPTLPTDGTAGDTAHTNIYRVQVYASVTVLGTTRKDTLVSKEASVEAKKRVSTSTITSFQKEGDGSFKVSATGNDSLAFAFYAIKNNVETKVAAAKVTVSGTPLPESASILSENLEAGTCYYVVVTDIVRKETNKLSISGNNKTATSVLLCKD